MSARAGPTSRPISRPRLHDHFVPFLDLQYLYALARAGKQSAVTEMLASLEDRAEQAKPFEREAWADCAVPAAHGLAAHARATSPRPHAFSARRCRTCSRSAAASPSARCSARSISMR